MQTDSLGSYKSLAEDTNRRKAARPDLVHQTVNHQKEFKTVDGVHTNVIEGLHGDFKTRQKKQHHQLKCKGSDEVGDAKRYMTVWKINLSLSEDDGEGNFVEFLRLVQNELQ